MLVAMQGLLSPEPTVREAQPADVLILWLPVFLMAGMGAYFALSREPAAMVLFGALGAAVTITALTWRLHETLLWRWCVAFALGVTLGLVLAQQRTQNLATHLLTERVWSATVSGTIQSAERAGAGWRVVLTDAIVDNDAGKKYNLRLSLRQKGASYDMGGKLTARASLMPPSAPFIPGMFDFQRHAYFQEIGGYGYVTRVENYVPPAKEQTGEILEHYREWISDRVYQVLPQPEAGIVTALLNGQRAGIAKSTTNMLQASGLQHIISISGLHVGLLAGVVFYFVRLLLACNMRLALTLPIKKIAAAVSLIAIIAYMFIVGLEPPTVRSVIMTGIILCAMIVDREAINLRLVAIAALIILLLQPESVLDIGFQLSFAAVVGLVAFFQMTQNFWKREFWQATILHKGLRVLVMSVMTTLIATLATAPLTLVHFQKIPILSMLANGLATPLVAFLVMPGTFLSYLLMQFHTIGDWPIQLMGWGVTGILRIAKFVASMPVSVWRAPSPSFMAVIVMMIGLYQLLVGKDRWRLAGLLPVAATLVWLVTLTPPDLVLTPDRVLAYTEKGNSNLYIEGRADGFQKDLLSQRLGKEKVLPVPCHGDLCDLKVAQQDIRIVRNVPALKQACDKTPSVIVTRYYLDRKCDRALVVDRHILDDRGGVALWLGDTTRMRTVRSPGANRPWQQFPVHKGWQFQKDRRNLKTIEERYEQKTTRTRRTKRTGN
jgi:competence protein ComEC